MSLCAAAASVAVAFWYFGTLKVDSSAAAAFDGDLGLQSFHSVSEAVENVGHCEFDSSAAAGMDGDLFLDEFHSVLEADGEVGHSVGSCLTTSTGGQATGRVDVPGDAHQPAAAAPQSSPSHFAPYQKGSQSSSVPSLVRRLLLVVICMRLCLSSVSVSITGVPVVDASSLEQSGCGRDALICMRCNSCNWRVLAVT